MNITDRMKAQYESRAQTHLPRRTYTIIRVDGRAFHTYTRDCAKPFDSDFVDAMNAAAVYLFAEAQGACIGFVQSDEISIVCQDFGKIDTQAWFDGNVQKIASVSASIATATFNLARVAQRIKGAIDSAAPFAVFDGCCFTIPDRIEVGNYLISRQRDWQRNAVQMVARSRWSHGECLHQNIQSLNERLEKEGFHWDSIDEGLRRGRIVRRKPESDRSEIVVYPAPLLQWSWAGCFLDQMLPRLP